MGRRVFALLLLLLAGTAAQAASARVQELVATEKDGWISVSFRLAGAFDTPEVRRALESGLPTVLTYDIELTRKRPNWFDDLLFRSKIEVIATYNSVTREYLLNYRLDRRLVRSEIFTSIEALKARMTKIEEKDIFSTAGRKPWKLRIKVRAELLRRYVWYVIPWDVSTEWEIARVEQVEAP